MKHQLATIEEEVARRVAKSPLDEFSEIVESTRQAFLDELATLPNPLGRVAKDAYLSRVRRGNGRAVLGEYAPWLIADLCGLQRLSISNEFLLAWLDIYSYIIFIDAAIDEPFLDERSYLLIASGLLLERGIIRIARLVPSGDEMLDATDQHLTETAVAAVNELAQHRRNLHDYSDTAVRELGKKVAALKICARYVLMQRGVGGIGELPLNAIDGFCTAIQLLDDITDWEEDWQSGNYTMPLTLTQQRLAAYGMAGTLEPDGLSKEELLMAMIATGSLEETLDNSIQRLEESLSYSFEAGTDRTDTGRFLSSLVDNCKWCRQMLKESREVLTSELEHCILENWPIELATRKNARVAAAKVALILPVVAQSS